MRKGIRPGRLGAGWVRILGLVAQTSRHESYEEERDVGHQALTRFGPKCFAWPGTSESNFVLGDAAPQPLVRRRAARCPLHPLRVAAPMSSIGRRPPSIRFRARRLLPSRAHRII